MIQITTLIIGPVFFTGALYVLLGMFINVLGRHYSIMSAKMYTYIFMTCDVISLIIQVSRNAISSTLNGFQNTDRGVSRN